MLNTPLSTAPDFSKIVCFSYKVSVMLTIRACCENCAKELPANSKEARICSFECTFCVKCVENILNGVCPNCAGEFQVRPVRPAVNFKNSNFLGQYPAEFESVYKPVDLVEHQKLIKKVLASKI